MFDITDEERANLFPIILSEYNPAWPHWYTEEKERLTMLIGMEKIVRIEHIGSTAISGLMAKPTVDILLEVAENTRVDYLIASMPDNEYICLRQQTIPTNDLVLFIKGYTPSGFAKKVFHIHVRYPGDWDEIHFRNYLLAHPEAADIYSILKRKLKEQYEHNRDGYTNAKGEFIQAVTRRAKNLAERMDDFFRMTDDFKDERDKMIEEQLIPRGIASASVLDAMQNVPRHIFIPENLQNCAYSDGPVPIGSGQTISQPYIVAYMTEQLDPVPGMRILEIGTGSGYQSAILHYLGCKVFTIELLDELSDKAIKNFSALGFDGIRTKCGNGYSGWPEEAPFDAIIVTAAPESIPISLVDQLKDGGRMVVPVGKTHEVQSLRLLTKNGSQIIDNELLLVRFVPMVK
ncbi:MAG: protein-L-isoaspartate(D-aspartate) O-methyltransferase [Oscillospiraceae bacterium]|nr:protein-L-isoaspartate(D-aspartate) O-methyltransferase [Oscillospiraceae bacterium]